MSVESVGSCTGSPQRSPPTSLFQQRNTSADHCFHCNQKGHWARECPHKTPGTPPPPPPPKNISPNCPQQQYPELLCKCNRPCAVKTSHTIRNQGRDFYTCANPIAEQCGTFSWCDNVAKTFACGANSPAKPDQQRGDQPQRPECLCKAGPCRIEVVEEEGDLKGCKYYACHLKKGQGACTHKVYITDMNMNHASKEMHLSRYQITEEPNNKGMVDHGAIKDKCGDTCTDEDLPACLPRTPRVDHEAKHLRSGSPPVKRLNFFEGSPSKLNRVEEWFNDAGNAVFNRSAVKKLSLTEAGEANPVRCVVCGEEGHEMSECIAVVMW